ncbi:hypothetical protein P4S72_27520 [Vibrio sp. PP-XX7]
MPDCAGVHFARGAGRSCCTTDLSLNDLGADLWNRTAPDTCPIPTRLVMVPPVTTSSAPQWVTLALNSPAARSFHWRLSIVDHRPAH